MVGHSTRHTAALDELVEWWQDLSGQVVNSRAVLLPAPPRWGRTHLLQQFTATVKADEALSLVVPVHGASLPSDLGLQAQALKELFSNARIRHQIAETVEADRLAGAAQLGLGVAGLWWSALTAQIGLLLAGVAVGAAGKVWDDSPAGQQGAVAKLARQVAALSLSLPVVVTIDDADRLEADLAVTLIENLIQRANGHVLVVVAVDPGGDLMSALTSRARYGLTEGRVRMVDVDPSMGGQARIDLAAELCPDLPMAATSRIGLRTLTFAEVFAVASAGRLTELDAQGDDAAAMTVVDDVIDAQVNRAPPSEQAVILAWAGGIMHSRQAERAMLVLGGDAEQDDGDDILRFESLVRLADPAFPQLDKKVRILASSERRRTADAIFNVALEIGRDPRAGLVEKIVAWQAAHHIRADLSSHEKLAEMQCRLVHSLEEIGDSHAAYLVAEAALTEYLAMQPDEQPKQRDDLSAAVLRLTLTNQLRHDHPLVETTITSVLSGAAAVGLEARLWAAIYLLHSVGDREQALKLTERVTAELESRKDLGAIGSRWRMLLAFHAGRAQAGDITQRLLAPLLAMPDSPEIEDAARAVLRTAGGPHADTQLQIIGLESELQALPEGADDECLRLHHALATDYERLGDYRRALQHGQEELSLRNRLEGPDHPDTLHARSQIALWTGYSGRPEEALHLFQAVLSDQNRVLGSKHPETLTTRNNIAMAIERSGHPAEALHLLQELLPDQMQVLGPDNRDTLRTRNNIAACAAECERFAEALRLYQALLPDRERVLGRDHPDTLGTRNNIAVCTGYSGHPAEALRLLKELLPDLQRVLGSNHPDTLQARSNIALWTLLSGHPVEALRWYQELLPDRERVLGPSHPDTLATQDRIQQLNVLIRSAPTS